MTNAVLAINNLFETASVVTASTESGTNVAENAFDGLLFDYWQPNAGTSHDLDIDMGSAAAAGMFGFYSSDLWTMTGATCTLYRSTDAITWVAVSVITPTTASPKLKLLTSAPSYRYWRLRFETTGSEQPKIQHAYIGTQTEMERGLAAGFAPMALGSENTMINVESSNGALLGRSLKKMPIKARLLFKAMSPAWMRTNWPTILAALEARPFMILPSPDNYTDEAAFCWTEGNIKTPTYDGQNLMTFAIPIKARIT